MAKAHDQPRSRRVLRLIAAERIIRGVLLLAAGVYLLFHVNSDFGRGAERVLRAVDLDPRRPLFHRLIAYLHHLHASEVRIAALFASTLLIINTLPSEVIALTEYSPDESVSLPTMNSKGTSALAARD